jgi:hypothetical protein
MCCMTVTIGERAHLDESATVPAEAHKAQLMSRGASEAFAQGLVDMFAAKDNGLDNHESRIAENTTPTTFRQWCNEVLKPAVFS